ncbi:uncharacterized protein LOC142634467 [Castanea sativa]|uniref:uncharacterized protein LOC142634467 n=1 Tax=Castanea sativa TaxID=21020 RepID=UPI003F6502D8
MVLKSLSGNSGGGRVVIVEKYIRKIGGHYASTNGGLGIKELVKFNDAMLAKQVWRLYIDKTSLFFKVFSTKFFPSGSVFNAKKSRGSYAWKNPGQFPTKAVPSKIVVLNEAKVSTMIDSESREWNVELLKNSLAPFLVHKILSIPICKTAQEDMLVWPRSRCGSYTVKTGYQLLYELENSEDASSSNSALTKAFWNRIWKLNLPNKMRLFCWRACSEALPTLQNLHHRKVIDSLICSTCGELEETTLHPLWDCTAIQSTKASLKQPLAPPTSVKWKPSRSDFYKVNYDGAMLKDSGKAGIGVVIRNENGEVMASLAEKITKPDCVEVLEALAARRAILFAIELGLQQVIIEGDSEIVFKALSGVCSDRSCIGHIFKDYKSILGLFQTHSSYTRRQCNSVAYALAKRARKSFLLLVWMESVPPDISYLVYVDVIR